MSCTPWGSTSGESSTGSGRTGTTTTAMLFSLQTLAFADADAIAKHLQLSSSITGVNYTGYVEPAITWPILPYTDD